MRAGRFGGSVRRGTLGALLAIAMGLGTVPALAVEPEQRAPLAPSGAVTVSEALRERLDRRASVPAIITTHDRAGLRDVRALGIRGAGFRMLPMLVVQDLTAAQLARLEATPSVRSVFPQRKLRLAMENSSWITRARYVWGPDSPTRWSGGFTGAGVDIAVIDTGVDGGHEDTDNLVEFCDAGGAVTGERILVACAGTPGAVDGQPTAPPVNLEPGLNAARAAATDDDGHGSHVSGTVAGTGDASGGITDPHSTIGIAPGARLHVYSANVSLFLLNVVVLAAYDDMIHKKVNHDSGVVATSNSFGGNDGANWSPDDPESVAIKMAYDAGIVSVYAAGNSGPEHDTLSDACVNPWVVCVGASTKPDGVVMFSSKGRPSEPADTDRDGTVGDADDVAPDNHDRRLGQALGIGLYRPTLVAPGANINSISANAAGCREGVGTDSGCYEKLNGTSMATPHVSGAIAVIVDAWRSAHGGATPSPATIIDILERSAARHKLPGLEAEEQGAGRLNVWDAVRYALGEIDLPRPTFGTPSPVYTSTGYPGHAATQSTYAGCTGPLSYTTSSTSNPIDEPADLPPIETEGFAEHLISVPERAERLRLTVTWPEHPEANLYVRLWRPGVDPDSEFSSDPSEQAYPDQEAVGLLESTVPPALPEFRWIDVRSPEAGTWTMRVYHRAGDAGGTCDPPGSATSGGYAYDVLQEITRVSRVPTVAISQPAAGSSHTDRIIPFKGTATYPTRWDGVTWWEVPGTGIAPGGDVDDPRIELHFQGNTEEGCSGDGSVDVSNAACNGGNGPSLLAKTALSSSAAAEWPVPNPILTFNTERDGGVPNWIWDISAETTLRGPMTVRWWAECNPCGAPGFSADWIIRIYADGTQQFEERVSETPSAAATPTLLEHTFDLPTITASDRFVLHIEPVYVDSQNANVIYYDSSQACDGGSTPACDSTVLMPVVTGESQTPERVRNLRVTDVHSGLRIAWDPVDGATGYQIHRSTVPGFTPSAATRLTTTGGSACTSPNVPSWPSASFGGARCWTDTSTSALRPYYYRVIARNAAGLAEPSLLAYGMESAYDRQVRLRADHVYGPAMWEFARVDTDGSPWRWNYDTFGRPAGTTSDPNLESVFARSYTQGIGSAKVRRQVGTVGEAPQTPVDPVVLFTKSGPATAGAGDVITYRLRYENLGPAPSSRARVVDTLPLGLRFVSASGNGTWDADRRTITWQLGTVDDGEVGVLTLRVRIPGAAPDGATYVNEARYRAALTFATPLGRATTMVQ